MPINETELLSTSGGSDAHSWAANDVGEVHETRNVSGVKGVISMSHHVCWGAARHAFDFPDPHANIPPAVGEAVDTDVGFITGNKNTI